MSCLKFFSGFRLKPVEQSLSLTEPEFASKLFYATGYLLLVSQRCRLGAAMDRSCSREQHRGGNGRDGGPPPFRPVHGLHLLAYWKYGLHISPDPSAPPIIGSWAALTKRPAAWSKVGEQFNARRPPARIGPK